MRAFESDLFTIAVRRVTLSNISGTLERVGSYSTVSGMTALPAVFQHQSASQAMKLIGEVTTGAFLVDIDNDVLPSGGEILGGDQIVVATGRYAGTYDVLDARLIQERTWNITVKLRPESVT